MEESILDVVGKRFTRERNDTRTFPLNVAQSLPVIPNKRLLHGESLSAVEREHGRAAEPAPSRRKLPRGALCTLAYE
jgi:hypothetical protein